MDNVEKNHISNLKRALQWPSFFVCCSLFFYIYVASSQDLFGLWLALSFLYFAWIKSKEKIIKFSAPVVCLSCLLFLMLISSIFNYFHIEPVAFYIICSGIFGILLFSALNLEQITVIYKFLIVSFSILAVWSIFQFIFEAGYLESYDERTISIFANRNTFAAIINIIIFPLITTYILNSRKNHKFIIIFLIILFAGLVATQSRSAWIAFIISFGFLNIFCFNVFEKVNKKRVVKVFFILLTAFSFLSILKMFDFEKKDITNGIKLTGEIENVIPYKAKSSLLHRLELNRIALKNIKNNPVMGIGYFQYIYYYNKDVDDASYRPGSYIYDRIYYAHNDYLQLWVELGLPGILLYLSVIILSYRSGLKKIKELDKNNKIYCISILASLTTFYIHSLASFLIYVPLLFFIYSAYLTVLLRISYDNKNLIFSKKNSKKTSLVISPKLHHFYSIIALFILAFLFQFVIGQISFRAGKKLLIEGRGVQASTLFSVARKFSPAKQEHYMVEANYWKNEAYITKESRTAERADKLYAEYMKNNPFDSESRLQRAILHRDFKNIMEISATKDEIIYWLKEALKWQPHHNILQAEYIRTLFLFGNKTEAKEVLFKYMSLYPYSGALKLLNEYINKN